jgi:hypothetical protein
MSQQLKKVIPHAKHGNIPVDWHFSMSVFLESEMSVFV